MSKVKSDPIPLPKIYLFTAKSPTGVVKSYFIHNNREHWTSPVAVKDVSFRKFPGSI